MVRIDCRAIRCDIVTNWTCGSKAAKTGFFRTRVARTTASGRGSGVRDGSGRRRVRVGPAGFAGWRRTRWDAARLAVVRVRTRGVAAARESTAGHCGEAVPGRASGSVPAAWASIRAANRLAMLRSRNTTITISGKCSSPRKPWARRSPSIIEMMLATASLRSWVRVVFFMTTNVCHYRYRVKDYFLEGFCRVRRSSQGRGEENAVLIRRFRDVWINQPPRGRAIAVGTRPCRQQECARKGRE